MASASSRVSRASLHIEIQKEWLHPDLKALVDKVDLVRSSLPHETNENILIKLKSLTSSLVKLASMKIGPQRNELIVSIMKTRMVFHAHAPLIYAQLPTESAIRNAVKELDGKQEGFQSPLPNPEEGYDVDPDAQWYPE